MEKTVKINLKYGRFEIKHSGASLEAVITVTGQRKYGCTPKYEINIPVDIWDIQHLGKQMAQVHANRVNSVSEDMTDFESAVKVE